MPNLVKDGVGDAAGQVVTDLDGVELAQMRLDPGRALLDPLRAVLGWIVFGVTSIRCVW
jgi:hypothetical protein